MPRASPLSLPSRPEYRYSLLFCPSLHTPPPQGSIIVVQPHGWQHESEILEENEILIVAERGHTDN